MQLGTLRTFLKGDSLRAQLLRGGAGSLIVRIGGTSLTFLVSAVLANLLGPAEYGLYAYIIALISLMAIPAQFGVPNLVVRETAKAQEAGHWGLMRGVWRWSSSVAMMIVATFIIVSGTAAWLFSDHFTKQQILAFAIGLSLMPMITLANIRGAALRGLRKVVAGQIPESIVRPGMTVGLVLMFWAFLSPANAITAPIALALHVVASLVAFLLGAYWLWQARPYVGQPHIPVTTHGREWLAAVLPMAFLAGVQVMNRYTDILVLGIFAPAEEIGIYRVAVQGGTLVAFGIQTVTMVISPYFARFHASGEHDRLKRIVRLSARTGFCLTLPIVILYVLFGQELLGIVFGDVYVSAYSPLIILSLGQLLNAGMGSLGTLLIMTGNERAAARGTAIAAGINITSNLLLAPLFGMNGAASSTFITFLVWNIFLWRAVSTHLDIKRPF